MRRCLFTYEPLRPDENNYSASGLKALSKKLTSLKIYSYNQDEQIQLAQKMAKKISIQGVQPKYSVVLSEKTLAFEEKETEGHYILKPQVSQYKQLPENEDLTMHFGCTP